MANELSCPITQVQVYLNLSLQVQVYLNLSLCDNCFAHKVLYFNIYLKIRSWGSHHKRQPQCTSRPWWSQHRPFDSKHSPELHTCNDYWTVNEDIIAAFTENNLVIVFISRYISFSFFYVVGICNLYVHFTMYML